MTQKHLGTVHTIQNRTSTGTKAISDRQSEQLFRERIRGYREKLEICEFHQSNL